MSDVWRFDVKARLSTRCNSANLPPGASSAVRPNAAQENQRIYDDSAGHAPSNDKGPATPPRNQAFAASAHLCTEAAGAASIMSDIGMRSRGVSAKIVIIALRDKPHSPINHSHKPRALLPLCAAAIGSSSPTNF